MVDTGEDKDFDRYDSPISDTRLKNPLLLPRNQLQYTRKNPYGIVYEVRFLVLL